MKYLSTEKDYVDTTNRQLPIQIKKVAKGTGPGDAVSYEQTPVLSGSSLNTIAGSYTYSGTNSHTGVNTFSHASGVTTNVITPATSDAGTSIKKPVGVFTGAAVTAAELLSGGEYGLSKADGQTIALPAIVAGMLGFTVRFDILTTCTSVGYVISAQAGDVMIGGLWATIANPDAGNDMEFNIADGTENTLTLGATTAAGLAGGSVEFTAISLTQWSVRGTVLGSGTIASNLFTTV